MATDYDAPRHVTEDPDAETTIGNVKTRAAESVEALAEDPDPFEADLDVADADATGEDLTVRVLPRQANEFACSRCYLIHHHSQLTDPTTMVCRDCA